MLPYIGIYVQTYWRAGIRTYNVGGLETCKERGVETLEDCTYTGCATGGRGLSCLLRRGASCVGHTKTCTSEMINHAINAFATRPLGDRS